MIKTSADLPASTLQRLSGLNAWREVPRIGPAAGDAVALVEHWLRAAPAAGSKYGLGNVQITGGGFTTRDPTYRSVLNMLCVCVCACVRVCVNWCSR